jgi:hypothetical protein
MTPAATAWIVFEKATDMFVAFFTREDLARKFANRPELKGAYRVEKWSQTL